MFSWSPAVLAAVVAWSPPALRRDRYAHGWRQRPRLDRASGRSPRARNPDILLNGRPIFLAAASRSTRAIRARRTRRADAPPKPRRCSSGSPSSSAATTSASPTTRYGDPMTRAADRASDCSCGRRSHVYWAIAWTEAAALARRCSRAAAGHEEIARDENRASVILHAVGRQRGTPVSGRAHAVQHAPLVSDRRARPIRRGSSTKPPPRAPLRWTARVRQRDRRPWLGVPPRWTSIELERIRGLVRRIAGQSATRSSGSRPTTSPSSSSANSGRTRRRGLHADGTHAFLGGGYQADLYRCTSSPCSGASRPCGGYLPGSWSIFSFCHAARSLAFQDGLEPGRGWSPNDGTRKLAFDACCATPTARSGSSGVRKS